MDDFVLNLVIRWLADADVFAASCVSSEWQQALSAERDNGDLWKQVCKNSYPQVFANLENDDGIDYRRFTLGLWRGVIPQEPADITYTPTLRLEQVFAVVELYQKPTVDGGNKRRKNVIDSWVIPITFPLFIDKEIHEHDRKVVLKGPNPYSASERDSEQAQAWRGRIGTSWWITIPSNYAAHRAMGGDYTEGYRSSSPDKVLRVTATLFRRDNMKSVRVFDEAVLADRDPDGEFENCLSFGNSQPLSSTNAGKTTRSMLFDGAFSQLCADLFLTLVPVYPPPASEEEPRWLANCRQALRQGRSYRPDATDWTALSSVSHFEFEIKQIRVTFEKVQPDEEQFQFENENEMMVAVEGLCWE